MHTSAGAPRGVRSHGVGITGNCKPPDMNAGNSGPLQEQNMFLASSKV